MSALDKKLQRATDQLAKDKRVEAIWLFGSTASHDETPMSDVDIAILAEAPLELEEEFELRRMVVEVLGRDDIDFVELRRADNPLLSYKVFTEGRRLFARNPKEIDKFEQRLVMRYLDTAYLRKLTYELRRESI